MWLVDVNDAWDRVRPIEEVLGTELALSLLVRTQELLGDGAYWRANALAYTWDGMPCDPLSSKAYYFSLVGAAAKARWEMREKLADAEIHPSHMKQVMAALSAVGSDHRGEGGWAFAGAVLEGMLIALQEYREQQMKDLKSTRNAA